MNPRKTKYMPAFKNMLLRGSIYTGIGLLLVMTKIRTFADKLFKRKTTQKSKI